MALHERLREQRDNIFSPTFFSTEKKNASVLLRTVALYALTYTENRFSARGAIIYGARPRELDTVTAYDACFPCGATIDGNIENIYTFDNRRTTRIDKIIKTNEVLPDYIPPEADPISTRYYVPPTPVLINADNNAASDNPRYSFFDEVNSIHNWHTMLARKVNNWCIFGTDDTVLPQIINVSSDNTRSIFANIQKTGNCEGVSVQNVGSYDPSKDIRVGVGDFEDLKKHFRSRENISTDYTTTNLRDLYRLECIREPAALLTNAMFLDLATVNNNQGYRIMNETISFKNIIKYMPMALIGAVKQCRDLWALLIRHSVNKNIPIYYRYDYAKSADQYTSLAKLENNLLFFYLIYKSDQINGNADIKTAIETAVTDGSFKVYFDRVFTRNFYITNYGIMTLHINPFNQLQNDNNYKYCISITQFPLKLLKNLLYEWYYVDLGDDLPYDFYIEIDLALQR